MIINCCGRYTQRISRTSSGWCANRNIRVEHTNNYGFAVDTEIWHRLLDVSDPTATPPKKTKIIMTITHQIVPNEKWTDALNSSESNVRSTNGLFNICVSIPPQPIDNSDGAQSYTPSFGCIIRMCKCAWWENMLNTLRTEHAAWPPLVPIRWIHRHPDPETFLMYTVHCLIYVCIGLRCDAWFFWCPPHLP